MAPMEKENRYENRLRNCPISGGRDLSCFWAERLLELYSPAAAGRRCWTVHRRPLCVALPVGDLRGSAHRWCTSPRKPLRTVGGGTAGTGNCQHPYFPRHDGPERASAGPRRGCSVGVSLRRCATGLHRAVPVALAATNIKG